MTQDNRGMYLYKRVTVIGLDMSVAGTVRNIYHDNRGYFVKYKGKDRPVEFHPVTGKRFVAYYNGGRH